MLQNIYGTNEFLPYETICQRYNLRFPFTRYMGIIDAISKRTKQILRQNEYEDIVFITNHADMLKKKLTSRYFYHKFIECQQVTQNIAAKWEEKLHIPVDRKTICNIFKNIKTTTLCTKLRSFQFRLLHNSIPTNDKLFLWGITESDKCTFCNIETETIIHLIWDCPTAKHIWSQLTSWIKNVSNRTIKVTLKNIIFCGLAPKAMDCVNTICIVVTQYIYSVRCLKKIPNFACLKSKILDAHNLEKYIAIKNNKLKKHEIKWKGFKLLK